MISSDQVQHTYDRVWTEGDGLKAPQWPLFALFLLLLFNEIFGSTIMKCLTFCFPSLEIGDVELDEDIDNYWASLDDKDRNWAMKEDEYATSTLGLQLFTAKQK